MSDHNPSLQNVGDLLLHNMDILSCKETYFYAVKNNKRLSSDAVLSHFLTVFNVFRSDSTDSCSVVRHPLCGFDEFVIDAFSKLVDEGHASQDAVLPIRTDSHHLTIDSYNLGDANIHTYKSEENKESPFLI